MARFEEKKELEEHVVDITRVAKVVKGGRRFGFRVVTVVGDNRGRVGIGVGKARGVPDAIHKGMDRARLNMETIVLMGSTIPHEIIGKCGGARVLLKPASPGTGVVASSNIRAVLKAVGIQDILTKSLGSPNALSVVYATMDGLRKLRSAETVARERGVPKEKVMPFWSRKR